MRKSVKEYSPRIAFRATVGLTLLFIFGAAFSGYAKGAKGGDVDIRGLLAKGISFDHIFDPYQGEDDPGLSFGEKQRKAMGRNLREREFKQAAELGFTHVRLNLGRAFLQEPREPFNLRPEGLVLLDKAVGMALGNGLGIIVDMHQIPTADIFHDAKALQAFRKMWKDLAAHYAQRSPKIVFELMNEPKVDVLTEKEHPARADLEKWRSIVKDLVNTIHREDPERYVIVSGAGDGDIRYLTDLGNLRLPRVIYTFHYYEPFMFTHQGATFEEEPLRSLRNIHYPVPGAEVQKWWERAKRKHYEDWPFHRFPHGFDKRTMRETLKPVLDFVKKEKALVYCGEFGAIHHGPPADRAKWIGDVAKLLEENGIGWCLWAYHSGFDLVDEKGRADEAVVKALGLKRN